MKIISLGVSGPLRTSNSDPGFCTCVPDSGHSFDPQYFEPDKVRGADIPVGRLSLAECPLRFRSCHRPLFPRHLTLPPDSVKYGANFGKPATEIIDLFFGGMPLAFYTIVHSVKWLLRTPVAFFYICNQIRSGC